MQVERFELILRTCYEGFVGFHRFLPASSLLGRLKPLSQDERTKLADEVSVFITNSAKSIQDLNRMLDLSQSTDRAELPLQFDKQVVSNLLQKLSKLGVQWDRMQRDHRKFNVSPYRLQAAVYAHLLPLPEDHQQDHDTNDHAEQSPKPTTAPSLSSSHKPIVSSPKPAALPRADAAFAQRYIDEIAPTKKLKEYEDLAAAQRSKLLQESRALQRRFSEEVAQSHHMEHTVLGISSLVSEFAAMIEEQTDVVQGVGQVAREVTQSVQLTDEQLLLTLERTQSHQWSMIFLTLGMSVLLLLLHFITP